MSNSAVSAVYSEYKSIDSRFTRSENSLADMTRVIDAAITFTGNFKNKNFNLPVEFSSSSLDDQMRELYGQAAYHRALHQGRFKKTLAKWSGSAHDRRALEWLINQCNYLGITVGSVADTLRNVRQPVERQAYLVTGKAFDAIKDPRPPQPYRMINADYSYRPILAWEMKGPFIYPIEDFDRYYKSILGRGIGFLGQSKIFSALARLHVPLLEGLFLYTDLKDLDQNINQKKPLQEKIQTALPSFFSLASVASSIDEINTMRSVGTISGCLGAMAGLATCVIRLTDTLQNAQSSDEEKLKRAVETALSAASTGLLVCAQAYPASYMLAAICGIASMTIEIAFDMYSPL